MNKRCRDYSKSKLLGGLKHKLFTGSELTRARLSKYFSKKLRGHLCKSGVKREITKKDFAEPKVLSVLQLLAYVTAGIAACLNSSSRQGFCYVLVFTDDVATNIFWDYPLKTRSGKHTRATGRKNSFPYYYTTLTP